MSERFLVLQSSYKVLSIGIGENGRIIDRIAENKLTASASLVPLAIKLLERNSLSLHDMSAIIVDQGPGAFGSLRVLLSTANAIGFALKLPIVGLDGLSTLTNDVIDNYSDVRLDENILIVPILNAYNAECYYGIYEVNLATREHIATFESGYIKIYTLIELLIKNHPHKKLILVGNGVSLYYAMLTEQLGTRATCINDTFDLASLDSMAYYGLQKWQSQESPVFKALPLYLKMQMYTSTPTFTQQ